MSSNQSVITPQNQPVAQVLNPSGTPLPQQRAWPFESSYLNVDDLVDYLNGRPNLTYWLDVCGFFVYSVSLGTLQCSVNYSA